MATGARVTSDQVDRIFDYYMDLAEMQRESLARKAQEVKDKIKDNDDEWFSIIKCAERMNEAVRHELHSSEEIAVIALGDIPYRSFCAAAAFKGNPTCQPKPKPENVSTSQKVFQSLEARKSLIAKGTVLAGTLTAAGYAAHRAIQARHHRKAENAKKEAQKNAGIYERAAKGLRSHQK
jgi:hypothetical protein